MSAPHPERPFQAVVIGASAGGLLALLKILKGLSRDYPLPIMVVQHRAKDQRFLLEEVLQSKLALHVKQADEKEKIVGGIYIAPPDYHLLVESDRTFSLSCDNLINYSRPSIDVLFETASKIYKTNLVGILLTGANQDGMQGLCSIRQMGGYAIAQSPEEADYPAMPSAAIQAGCTDDVMTLEEIHTFLKELPSVL